MGSVGKIKIPTAYLGLLAMIIAMNGDAEGKKYHSATVEFLRSQGFNEQADEIDVDEVDWMVTLFLNKELPTK